MQLFIFSPSPFPALLSLLPADPGGSHSSSPKETSPTWGEVSKVSGLIFISLYTLPSSPAANGKREESTKEKKTLRRNLVICRFFPGLVCTLVSERGLWQGAGWDRGQGSDRQMSRVASFREGQLGVIAGRSWHPVRVDKPGEPSNEPPAMWHSPQAGFTRHLRFPLRSCDTIHGDLPDCCRAA